MTKKRTVVIAWLVLAALVAGVRPAAAAPEKAEGGIRFTYTDPNAGTVNWAGAFNGWSTSANPLAKGANGVWSVVVALPAGAHEYKFVVDGQWVADPENPATVGDMGNSVVKVGNDGSLGVAAATSNTPYSARILVGGRTVGLFQDEHSSVTRRFELRRPNMDTNVDFGVRVSDAMQMHMLMDINTEKQSTQDYRTSLTMDRGSMQLTRGPMRVAAWDNEALVSWDDPMHLVGNVGIYAHPYGYHRQGLGFGYQRWGFDAQALYADNFEVGGTTYPAYTTDQAIAIFNAVAESVFTITEEGVPTLRAGQRLNYVKTDPSDQNADMTALRIRRPIGRGFTLGVLGRVQRGFDLGTTYQFEVTSPTTMREVVGTFDESYGAFGAEATWEGPRGLRAWGEALRGDKQLRFVPGKANSVYDYQLSQIDESTWELSSGAGRDISGTALGLDRSDRWLLGGSWAEAHGDIVVRAELERQTHRYTLVQDGIHNAMTVARFGWDRDWRYYLGRRVRTSLDLERTTFTYDARTPWGYQLWFPDGNLWLERTEHVVSVDRMVMLGGDDAVRTRTMLEVPFAARRNGVARWKGTFENVSLGRLPMYAENRLQVGLDLTRFLRLGADSRWVKYDAPFFGLESGYLSHFVDATYTFAPGATLALGFGVDPWVMDDAINDWADIGRDAYLFARGATGANAHDDYYGLGAKIGAAEKALENARVVQIKAVVHW